MIHLKYVHAVAQGIFYKAATIHSDIFNTCVDIVRQKLSTLADFGQNSTQRKRWLKACRICFEVHFYHSFGPVSMAIHASS